MRQKTKLEIGSGMMSSFVTVAASPVAAALCCLPANVTAVIGSDTTTDSITIVVTEVIWTA
jgi:hypothetical protein